MTEAKQYRCPACRFEAGVGGEGFCPISVDESVCPHCNNSVKPQLAKPKKVLKQRISRQRRQRLDKDAEYLAVRDIYLGDNPICAECGQHSTRYHHFCNGATRGSSLTNTDLGMGGCEEHGKAWDNKGDYPMAKQFAIKFRAMLKRYREITGKRVAVEDVTIWMDELERGIE